MEWEQIADANLNKQMMHTMITREKSHFGLTNTHFLDIQEVSAWFVFYCIRYDFVPPILIDIAHDYDCSRASIH